jgi:uncharacterized protein (DUF2235 family)
MPSSGPDRVSKSIEKVGDLENVSDKSIDPAFEAEKQLMKEQAPEERAQTKAREREFGHSRPRCDERR